MRTTTFGILLGSLLGLVSCVAQAQSDPNRYRPDPFFGTGGYITEALGSAAGQPLAAEWTDRTAKLGPIGTNSTGWVHGGVVVSAGELVYLQRQRLVTDQGQISTGVSREFFGFRSLGGVVPSADGVPRVFVSWLAGRPSADSTVSQFRYANPFPDTGCAGSFFFNDDYSGAGLGRDEVLSVRRTGAGGAYAVGTYEVAGGEFRGFIVRYAGDCTRDTSFGGGFVSVDARRDIFQPARRVRFNDVRIDPSGKPVAVGGVMYSTTGISEGDCLIARFNTNGTLDTTFDGDGILLYRPATTFSAARCEFTDVDFDSSQRLVVVIEVENASFPRPAVGRNPGDIGALRFNSNGSLSSNLGFDQFIGGLSNGVVGAGLAVLDNGDIVFGSNLVINVAGTLVSRGGLRALRPDTTTGVPIWTYRDQWPGAPASAMINDILELPGSGFLLTGYTGSGRFDHRTAVLGRLTFGQRYSVSVSVTGTGIGVVSGGTIQCGPPPAGPFDCFVVVDEGQSVTLTATPGAGSYFAGWSGAGCGSAPTCTFQVNANTSLSAAFARNTLTVQRTGAGTGNVTSSPAGINCGATCSADFNAGQVVTLSATPQAGSLFVTWQGDAAPCGSNPSCAISMNSAQAATAVFAPGGFPVNVTLNGFGLVTSTPAGINCGSTCSASFSTGSTVTLLAENPPLSNFAFANWGGDAANCGTNPLCAISMNAARNVTANFPQRQIAVTVTTSGTGTVSSSPAGISGCSGSCANNFGAGSVLTLTATPGAGQRFVGWSAGAVVCGSNPQCSLQPSNPITATATFAPLSDQVFGNGFEP